MIFFTMMVDKYFLSGNDTTTPRILTEKCSIPLITEDKVTKLLANLEENKATGLDGVSAKLLQLLSPVLSKTITRLLIFSIATGTFPSTWNIGKVLPIYKSGNKSERNNFRPISVLCNLSKILEKHIHESLYTFLINHSVLYLAQSGFLAFHSCQSALTRLVDKWTSNMEEGLLNGIVLLDLRKAFDLVNTEILLQKLKIYNLDDNSVCWFKSYLQGRHLCVQFKGKMSEIGTSHTWCAARQYHWTTFIFVFYE